jgi:hypothetical protein
MVNGSGGGLSCWHLQLNLRSQRNHPSIKLPQRVRRGLVKSRRKWRSSGEGQIRASMPRSKTPSYCAPSWSGEGVGPPWPSRCAVEERNGDGWIHAVGSGSLWWRRWRPLWGAPDAGRGASLWCRGRGGRLCARGMVGQQCARSGSRGRGWRIGGRPNVWRIADWQNKEPLPSF